MDVSQPWKDNRGNPENYNARDYRTHQIPFYDKDGHQLFHHTWVNKQTGRHVSYDTYDGGAFVGHVYVYGSGHERTHPSGEIVARWDGNGVEYNYYDAYGNKQPRGYNP